MLYRQHLRRRFASARKIFRYVCALLLCAIATVGTAQAQVNRTGSIQGTITDPGGKPVIGATVWAIRVFSAVVVTGPMAVNAESDANGGYQISGLPQASYRVCVRADNVMLLDPCIWSPKPPLANLAGGQAARMDIALEQGRFVYVRVDDPAGALAAAEQTSKIPAITLRGISPQGHGARFIEVSSDATGRNYRVLVPMGNDIPVQVESDVELRDNTGSRVRSLPVPPSLRGDDAGQSIKLSVE